MPSTFSSAQVTERLSFLVPEGLREDLIIILLDLATFSAWTSSSTSAVLELKLVWQGFDAEGTSCIPGSSFFIILLFSPIDPLDFLS